MADKIIYATFIFTVLFGHLFDDDYKESLTNIVHFGLILIIFLLEFLDA